MREKKPYNEILGPAASGDLYVRPLDQILGDASATPPSDARGYAHDSGSSSEGKLV